MEGLWSAFRRPERIGIRFRAGHKDFVLRAGKALSPKALRPGKHSVRLATRLRAKLPGSMPTWETKIKLSTGSTRPIKNAIASIRFKD